MIAQPQNLTLSPQEYLNLEAASETKHEYYQGEVYAMAGATQAHGLITLNLGTLFRQQLRGQDCRPFVTDIKVNIETGACYFYPDVVVTCDPRDQNLMAALVNYPVLIAEVLSETTESLDRGRKFIAYQKLDSLQYYLLVSQTEARLECYHRQAPQQWLLTTYKTGDTLIIPGLNFTCAIADIYEDVNLG
ncbi:Uma2 family endonuclease [Synechococcus sp. PCC 6312]|uniref:Uma2 family endonuclease n=1 Tax=Synechococcus sp. (strain ATCC 27167 / PCC 6312) TaxID=195253 RepID=UPI00029EF190|nr:Uma2 family endonuclease [Synechococcus sp. PCC 6312]AFY59482.1 hypothetical protein Syn6312_0241 [Synechococcus sp. PCC 6312]